MRRDQEHQGEVIGRCPAQAQISPSKRYPWYGAFRKDVRFTDQQLESLAKRSIDAEGVEAIEVRREANMQTEVYVPLNSWPPLYAFECPVIGRSGDRVRIIAPDGGEKLIRSDGWAHKPRTRPYQGSYW